ncbi:hypothetical protein Vi05172_g13474 [Venturia inaequalis]|uniref:Uncharacterized protein n=1 Tax=Venturia inaequalis TaxID=5025 RepID=A0A8H3UE83_VENIN|nr:hypothetical protein EG327_011237 [Venturia inaequalis]RDI76551.1 hypothetical protein Vi05172_g13474 [Venturia inaequalis]
MSSLSSLSSSITGVASSASVPSISSSNPPIPFTTTTSTTYPPNTILTGTEAILPTPLGLCGGSIATMDTRNPACAVTASDFSSSILLSCCNGAPRFQYSNGCNLYCEAKNQTLKELNECITGGLKGNVTSGIVAYCNRDGESFSSTVPAETQTALGTATATATATAGAVSLGRNGDGILSKGGLAVVVVFFGSLVAGAMI